MLLLGRGALWGSYQQGRALPRTGAREGGFKHSQALVRHDGFGVGCRRSSLALFLATPFTSSVTCLSFWLSISSISSSLWWGS